MCGIAGMFDRSARTDEAQLQSIGKAMGNALAHRGPDDDGVWSDPSAGIALAFRRLAIRDLSPAGHQPMISASGRYVISYNGEIYSQDEIAKDVVARDVAFRGHSDTEVMLESIAHFGIKPTVERLIGMFAIALWDREERTLTLIRDRLGIKPLYWAQFGELILWGSELKPLHAHPGFQRAINHDAVAGYLRHAYVPAPLTIYQGVQKLPPGCMVTLRAGAEPKIESYWDARAIVSQAVRQRFDYSDAEATDQLEALLKDAIGRRLIADVPLGAFLSGGIDSSTVVALMQAQSSRPVQTYTIGFNADGFDEAQHAKAVAKHLGTAHTELYVEPDHARDIIPRLADIYDEPFADSSQIPTFLVSEMTRRHVTVALSGDGGDELFAGYNRYTTGQNIWNRLQQIPGPLRSMAACAVHSLSPAMWDRLTSPLPRRMRNVLSGRRLYKAAGTLGDRYGDSFYRALVTQWDQPDRMVPQGHEPHGVLWDRSVRDDVPDFVERMQYLDLMTYLPDDILTKVDRASMDVALEVRVPLIDHRVVDFAFRLPTHLKLRHGKGKWLLRQVLYKHVPKELVERPKMGFGVPLAAWLRGPLRDWAEDLLDAGKLAQGGLVDPAPVRQAWTALLAGGRGLEYPLWTILMLEAWRRRWA
ncbi:MAG TPA: asparagine synthase (glutamine-hydrolyzing) [Magnetospirillaceae bacterium]|jgi:asparagine synthase (glutamine-hydrolysing)